ncbi:MAG TPA: 3-oxo-tetronate kinase [Micromonosporaceae bacterium]
MSGPWLGIVADDVTGACDVAEAVSEQGASAIVTVGTPPGDCPDCDCAVVALKSRTAPRDRAVEWSLAAARWLRQAGCTTLYQKYCSTFDSTDDGNIGPVADALTRLLAADAAHPVVSVGTPATPRVGRTVYQGHLFVGRQLLSDSPLRDHPLTPMRDPNLVAVLSRQTTEPVALVPWSTVVAGPVDIRAAIAQARRAGARHVLLDALTEDDLDHAAVALTGTADVVTAGAAGLAAALARVRHGHARSTTGSSSRRVPPVPAGRRLILSGSCSARTREQVAAFTGPRVELCPLDLAAEPDRAVDAVLDAVRRAFDSGDAPVLVSSSAGPERVAEYESRLGVGRPAALLEAATAEIARRAVDVLGVRRLLVAGGETSGAVVQALGISTLRVGPAAGPGLPWMVPTTGTALALLLKSGNFGDADLYTSAWRSCP